MPVCADCGGPLPVQNGRGRRRTMCEKCSPSRRRTPAPRPKVVELPVSDDGAYESARQMLAEADRLNTPMAKVTLGLAARFDAAVDSGSGFAALAKQFQASLDSAMQGAQVVASPMDELRARRAAKHG